LGGFSAVYELASIRLDASSDQPIHNENESESLQQLIDSCYFSPSIVRTPISQQGDDCRYVVKVLRDDLPPEEFVKGYNDLVTESNILKTLSHDHIISVRALAKTEASSTSSRTLSRGYFLVLDRLSCTLQSKLTQWKDILSSDPTTVTYSSSTKSTESLLGSIFSCLWLPDFKPNSSASKSLLLRLWLERFIILRDIASALHYLHDKNIIYRDLVCFVFQYICVYITEMQSLTQTIDIWT